MHTISHNLKGQNIHHHHPQQTSSVTPHTTPTSTGTAPGPMDLTTAGRSRKRGPIDNEEKKRRRDNSLCMYCGQPGHWATNCPHKRQKINTAYYNLHCAWYVCPQYPFVQSKFLIFNVSTYFPSYTPPSIQIRCNVHNTNETSCWAKLVRAPTARGTEICHIWVGISRKHLSLL